MPAVSMPFGSAAALAAGGCEFDEHPVPTARMRVRKVTGSLTSTLPSTSRNFEYKAHGYDTSTIVGKSLLSREFDRPPQYRRAFKAALLPAAVKRLHCMLIDVIRNRLA